jgi:inosose dehydratase
MQDHLNLLKMVEADVFVFADVSGSIQGDQSRKLSTRPNMDDEEFVEYCKKINEISNRLNNEGMPMSYHEHMGTIIQTEHDVDRFMENTNDNTFLLYDTGHLLFAQADYERVLKSYVTKINHVHCKDIRKNILENSLKNDLSFRESFLDGVFTVPGDGCINYEPLVKILYENNYEKWLIIEAEQDPKKANPLEYAKIGYNYLSKKLNTSNYEY